MTTTDPKGPSGTETTRILSGLTHELRTPLGSILMMSELLAEDADGNLGDREARYAGNIHRAAADLLHLVDHVGELARIDSGRLRATANPVDPATLARRIEERFADAEGSGVALEVEIGEEADPIETDVEKAERVLALLIESALKVTEEGTVRVHFDRGDRSGNGEAGGLRIEIQDAGSPLTEDERDALFIPFAAAGPRSSRRFGGSGLGLPLAHALTRLLGGELTAACTPEGCRYTLLLPGNPSSP